jgi:AraC family transcriptional regulator
VSKGVRLGHGQFYGACERRCAAGPFALSTLEARPHVDSHTHSEAHFIFVLSGAYVSSAANADDVCGRATLIYNPPGTTHRDRFQSAKGRFFGLSIQAEDLAALDGEGPFRDHAHRLTHPRALMLAASAAQNMNRDPIADGAVLESLGLELLANVATKGIATGRTAPRWLKHACALIDDDLGASVSVARIARAVGVHPVHLARVFRAHLGASPGEYARRRRIERATGRLIAGRDTLADIAAALGYADQSHFTREFAREAGHSPARFRNALS